MEANIEEQLREVRERIAQQGARLRAAHEEAGRRCGDAPCAVPRSALDGIEEAAAQVRAPGDLSTLGLTRA
jgi:hypothetical protein